MSVNLRYPAMMYAKDRDFQKLKYCKHIWISDSFVIRTMYLYRCIDNNC